MTKREAQVAAPTVTKDIQGYIYHYYAHRDNGDGKSNNTARLPVKSFFKPVQTERANTSTPDMLPV